ncbi:MAG: sensor histidine kinase [Actinomycetota bacterium]
MTTVAMTSSPPDPASAPSEHAGTGLWPPRLLRPRTARELVFLITRFPVGLFWFIAIVTLFSLGTGLLIVMIGFVVIALLALITRFGAQIERQFVSFVDGRRIEPPYRAPENNTPWGHVKARLVDPATYRDVIYLILQFPIGIIALVVLSILGSLSIGAMALPFYYWSIPGGVEVFVVDNEPSWVIDTLGESLIAAAGGFVMLFLAPYPISALATVGVWLGRGLLGPTARSRIAAADQRSERSVAANLVERKRIERDLHDGAQQQLVAAAMNLGRAQAKFDASPDEARALMDSAQEQTKAAIVELRNLARGIMPAVLTDRGLDAALSALAQQSHLPVSVRVEVDERPPEPVESAAYFVVAEALTNAAKHAGASEARIDARQHNGALLIEVSDNGQGGANAEGEGLRGLADRVSAVGGRLSVHDGVAGGTVVRAELPCES